MGNPTPDETADLLQAFGYAWNAHDADAVISLMTDDCVWHAAAGPDLLGTTYVGAAAVRAAIEAFFEANPKAVFVDDIAVVAGDRGFTEWTLRTQGPDGQPLEVRGCDLLTFRNGLIAVKNGFRKAR